MIPIRFVLTLSAIGAVHYYWVQPQMRISAGAQALANRARGLDNCPEVLHPMEQISA
jgi:hypothetical protein